METASDESHSQAQQQQLDHVPSPIITNDLIIQSLSLLPVKSLMRNRCVCNNWNSLVVDPSFVKLHLQRSPRNRNLVAFFSRGSRPPTPGRLNISCWERREMPPFSIREEVEFIFTVDSKYRPLHSCNGLVCLVNTRAGPGYRFRFCNPATRLMSEESPFLPCPVVKLFDCNMLGFGYDKSNNTYKVVVVIRDIKTKTTKVKAYTMGDHHWRDIQSFPAYPVHNYRAELFVRNNVYMSGTLNWLAARNVAPDYNYITAALSLENELIIVSLDLTNETYRQMRLPEGLDNIIEVEKKSHLGVLMDSLCFSCYYSMDRFVVWKMKEFGMEDSWTLLASIGLQDLPMPSYEHSSTDLALLPLNMSKNGEVLTLVRPDDNYSAIFYNCREDEVVGVQPYGDYLLWWMDDHDYTESLVSPL